MESDEGYGNRHVARGVATILDVSDRRFTFDEGVTVNHQDDCRAPLDPLRGSEKCAERRLPSTVQGRNITPPKRVQNPVAGR